MGRMALPKNDCILLGRWILHLLLIHAQSISMECKCGRQREPAHRVKGAGEGCSGRRSGVLGMASFSRVDDSQSPEHATLYPKTLAPPSG